MKNIKKLIFVVSILASGYSSAATITLGSSTTNVNTNDTFTIDIIGNNFVCNVDGGGVNFTFDSSILNVVSVSIDETVWDFGGFGINTGTIDNTNGTLDGLMVNTFANVTGDFVVATIEMQAVAGGSSSLLLSEYVLNPWGSAGNLINPDFIGGTVNVSSVPVPAAVWLMGSGLIGLAGFSRRKNKL